jgi:hypothetical protein
LRSTYNITHISSQCGVENFFVPLTGVDGKTHVLLATQNEGGLRVKKPQEHLGKPKEKSLLKRNEKLT